MRSTSTAWPPLPTRRMSSSTFSCRGWRGLSLDGSQRPAYSCLGKPPDVKTHTDTDTHTDTHRHRHTHRHTQTHTDRQTHPRARSHTQTHRHTDTHTHTSLFLAQGIIPQARGEVRKTQLFCRCFSFEEPILFYSCQEKRDSGFCVDPRCD